MKSHYMSDPKHGQGKKLAEVARSWCMSWLSAMFRDANFGCCSIASAALPLVVFAPEMSNMKESAGNVPSPTLMQERCLITADLRRIACTVQPDPTHFVRRRGTRNVPLVLLRKGNSAANAEPLS
jgi:hypothetical protein